MITSFAIIVNEEIIYVSQREEELKFEVVIFANAFLKLLNQKNGNRWKLHKIILQPIKSFHKEKILIHQIQNNDLDLEILYCVLGKFSDGSKIGFEILEAFKRNIEQIFPIKSFKSAVQFRLREFWRNCEEIGTKIEEKYEQRIQNEKNLHETFSGESILIYSGISSQGLPIVSKLHNPDKIIGNHSKKSKNSNNKKEDDKEIDIFKTILSGQLTAISINSFIRAKAHVTEIQILMDETYNNLGFKKVIDNKYGFINFAQIGADQNYTFEMFMIGPSRDYFTNIRNAAVSNFDCLQKPFDGKLYPYKKIEEYLSSLSLRNK
ncbi:MAG: hypothetical protein ACTSWY_08185 [Promethearchaeota archaeon]